VLSEIKPDTMNWLSHLKAAVHVAHRLVVAELNVQRPQVVDLLFEALGQKRHQEAAPSPFAAR
jgi:heterodisulfide reductase subunit B